MKKILLFLFLALLLTGCKKIDRPAILFNREQITEKNVMNYSNEFLAGQRVYYLVLMPKKVESRALFVRVIKKGSLDRLGYSLYTAKDIRLKDEEIHYFTDYIVPNSKGVYVMKVYSKDRPTKTYTEAEFFVRE
jgi:hypothetical protein